MFQRVFHFFLLELLQSVIKTNFNIKQFKKWNQIDQQHYTAFYRVSGKNVDNSGSLILKEESPTTSQRFFNEQNLSI